MGLERYCSALDTSMYFNAIKERIAKLMSRIGKCKNDIIASLSDRVLLAGVYRRRVPLASYVGIYLACTLIVLLFCFTLVLFYISHLLFVYCTSTYI